MRQFFGTAVNWVFYRPAVDYYDRLAGSHSQGDFAQRSPASADGDDSIGCLYHQPITKLADASRQRHRKVRIGAGSIMAWEQADGRAAKLKGSLTGGRHDPAVAAADQDRIIFGK